MNTVADLSKEKFEQTLANEIANARHEARPVSRLSLTRLLQSELGVNPHDAERFVDRYCDEKEPAIPTYLSTEFGVPYLKVVAVLNVLLAIGFFVVTLKFQRPGLSVWPGIILGTLFLIGAAVMWLQSLRPPKQKEQTVRLENELPNIQIAGEPTAPLQTRS